MPHFTASTLALPSFPCTAGEYTFEFSARKEGESLIGTRYRDEKEFLIQMFQREDDYLVKVEKSSRISPVGLIKDALKVFAELSQATLTHSNLSGSSARQYQESDYLVTPDFFLDAESLRESNVIEIGFGSGRHILHRAKNEPNTLFIGLEVHTPSIEQVIRQIELEGLQNLYIISYDARQFLEMVPSDHIDEIIVHFPIPWDKQPQKRVISKEFLSESTRVLKPDGKLHLRTDSRSYFDYSLEKMLEMNTICLNIYKNREWIVSSKYEDRWKKMEKNIFDLILTNHQESPEKPVVGDFVFHQPLSCPQNNDLQKKDSHFISLKQNYSLQEEQGCLTKIIMGEYDKPVQTHLLTTPAYSRYFGRPPAPTPANLAAHQTLCELLGEPDHSR